MASDTEAISKAEHRGWWRFILIALIICIILGVGISIYYYYSANKDTLQPDNDEFLNDSTPETAKWVNNEEIQLFRKYLTFPTISLEADFEPCVKFLRQQANELGLEVLVFYIVNRQNPVVLMTWRGSQPELPSIVLNSHMDVVPVSEEYWDYPPFGAKIDKNGNIYARGTQDMKSVGMQYLAAIRAIKRQGITQLKRTVYLTYVPDEETGGDFGLEAFVKTEHFKNLNVGFVLDEGYPSVTDQLEVFYAEKTEWNIDITSHGHSGHSSVLFEDTAGEKLNYIIGKFMEFRRGEMRKLKESNYNYGNVTTINLTILKGGLKPNVVPPEFSANIDMRLAMNTDWDELDQRINRWAQEAGKNVTLQIYKGRRTNPTRIDSSNPYWIAFKNAAEELRLNITPGVFRAATDSRFIRSMNIPALGFSPLTNTPPMLHEHNEFVNADTYLKGITIYEKIIESIANV